MVSVIRGSTTSDWTDAASANRKNTIPDHLAEIVRAILVGSATLYLTARLLWSTDLSMGSIAPFFVGTFVYIALGIAATFISVLMGRAGKNPHVG